jgi:spore coat protein CotH
MVPSTVSRLVCVLLACIGVLVSWPAAAQTQTDLFDDTRLQDVYLTVSQRDWEALKANPESDAYYPADLRWSTVTVHNAGIRSRGNSTRNGVKPGLRVDMNRYIDQTFLGLRALVLDNAYTDPTLMREVLSMKLVARLGLPGPREAFARLFVNDEFAGVYVLVEPVDRTFVLRVFGDAEGNVEDGGYLYEYQWVREYGFEYLGPSLPAYAELFSPRTHETDAPARVYQPLEALARAVNDTSPDRVGADVGPLLDIPQFVRFLAAQRAAGEIDGFIGNWGMSNFYLYRFRDGRPAQFVPWDADHAFWDSQQAIDDRLDTNVLVRTLMAVPAQRQAYLQTLTEAATALAGTVAGDDRGWLEREADRLAALVRPALAADTGAAFTLEEFDGNLQNLLAFLRARPSYLLCAAGAALDGSGQSCPLP